MPVLPGAEPFAAPGSPDPQLPGGGRLGALLLHGFTGCPQSMRSWAEYLAGAGLAVELPRLPGHGTRWQEMNHTRWQDWYAEADRALSVLRARCDHVVVMGLSMGATLTLRLAEERGAELTGIVVVNASLTTTDPRARFAPLLARVLPALPGVGGDIARKGVFELSYRRVPLRAFTSLQELWRITRADLSKISCPLLAYRSATDHVVEPINGQLLLAGVSSVDVTEEVLPRSFHVATLDYDAETIFAGSLDFARRLAGAAPVTPPAAP